MRVLCITGYTIKINLFENNPLIRSGNQTSHSNLFHILGTEVNITKMFGSSKD